MATHRRHELKECFYFVTFTCYKWIPLFDLTDLYDYFPSWVKNLKRKNIVICGYVIMPNHLHLLLYQLNSIQDLNLIIGESKRFMAYEIVKRLKKRNFCGLLNYLRKKVDLKERLKGKKHQIFIPSFDAKQIIGDENILNVLEYIHHNPVKGKWKLVEDYRQYSYSSAGFYELDRDSNVEICDFRDVVSRNY